MAAEIVMDDGTSKAADSAIVFFDLETTGLEKTSQIIQISAKTGKREFNAYILPSRQVSSGAILVTGLCVEDGHLYKNDEKLETVPRRDAMKGFIHFLQPGPVTLIAHNGNRFDFPLLLAEVSHLGLMKEFSGVVRHFMDTLPFLRMKLPERYKAKRSFSQSRLAADLVGSDAALDAHNAIADVRMLEMILKRINVTDDEIRSHAITVESKMI